MKTLSITQLARAFGLSRSTLLYYDRIRLLPPSGRTGSGYRFYTDKDRRRLQRICYFRHAGLTLEEVRVLLATYGNSQSKVLEKRLGETAKGIVDLRQKQRLLAGMLRGITSKPNPQVDKKLWVEMLRAAGVDDASMARWHAEFERRAPEGHHEFLLSLGILEKEVAEIRQWSKNSQGETSG